MENPCLRKLSLTIRLIYSRKLDSYSRRHFKMKKSKNVKPKVCNSDKALEHFDLHYRPVYKEKWPSIRISLLTAKKTCAIMNNYVVSNKYIEKFTTQGAYDIIKAALSCQQLRTDKNVVSTSQINKVEVERNGTELLKADNLNQLEQGYSDVDVKLKRFEKDNADAETAFITLNDPVNTGEDNRMDLDRTNLYRFIPAETVFSESHKLSIEEAKRSVFTPLDVKVDIVKPRKINLPMDLRVLGFPSGDVTLFPSAKADKPNGLFCYFMLDAASVLPVVALDLEKGDNVLDLCAAPGGKSLGILQTGLAGSLTCNDLSRSRMVRLLNILQMYVPKEKQNQVTVKTQNGLAYNQPEFDKVLVDVPCNTDRHVLQEDDNNLFSQNRINERIEMPNLQKNLLMSGIKSCRPGGCVVYSTCTLSPAQNDGVVQSTLDDLWRNTDIDVVVEDLEEISEIFKDTFNFYEKCRFGQLVIPSLSSNYGPMYFCRLRRIK